MLALQPPSLGSSQGSCVHSRLDLQGGGEWIAVLSDSVLPWRQQESRGEERTELALAQTPNSCRTSVITMPLELCSFTCKVGTLRAPLSSVQNGDRAEEAVRQSTNISCFYLCLNFTMGALFLSPFLTSGGRLRTSCVGKDEKLAVPAMGVIFWACA